MNPYPYRLLSDGALHERSPPGVDNTHRAGPVEKGRPEPRRNDFFFVGRAHRR